MSSQQATGANTTNQANDNANLAPEVVNDNAEQVEEVGTLDDMDAAALEELFTQTLIECNQLSKDNSATKEVVMAKMVNYCIRMLHSEEWIPQTIVRAMVLREKNPELRIRRSMYLAFREKRREMRAARP